jgi:Protein of unknown function (DUF1674)
MALALSVTTPLGKPAPICYIHPMSDTRSKRPAHVKAPAYLSKSPPVPKPAPMVRAAEPDPDRIDPVRYGDWELKGIAVDF